MSPSRHLRPGLFFQTPDLCPPSFSPVSRACTFFEGKENTYLLLSSQELA